MRIFLADVTSSSTERIEKRIRQRVIGLVGHLVHGHRSFDLPQTDEEEEERIRERERQKKI